ESRSPNSAGQRCVHDAILSSTPASPSYGRASLDTPLFHGMTGHAHAGKVLHHRPFAAAAVIGMRAARVESAAAWRIEWIGHLSRNRCTGLARVVHLRDGVEQHPRIRVARTFEQFA